MKSWFHFSSSFCLILTLFTTALSTPVKGHSVLDALLSKDLSIAWQLTEEAAAQAYGHPSYLSGLSQMEAAASRDDLKHVTETLWADNHITSLMNVGKTFEVALRHLSYNVIQYLIELDEGILDKSTLKIAIYKAVEFKKHGVTEIIFRHYRGTLPLSSSDYDNLLVTVVGSKAFNMMRAILEYGHLPPEFTPFQAWEAAARIDDVEPIKVLLEYFPPALSPKSIWDRIVAQCTKEVLQHLIGLDQEFFPQRTYVRAIHKAVLLHVDFPLGKILSNYHGEENMQYKKLMEVAISAKNYDSMRTILLSNSLSRNFSLFRALAFAGVKNPEAIEILRADANTNAMAALRSALQKKCSDELLYIFNSNLGAQTYVTAIHEYVQLHNDDAVRMILHVYQGPINYGEILMAALQCKNYASMGTILKNNRLPPDFSIKEALDAALSTQDVVAVWILLEHHLMSAVLKKDIILMHTILNVNPRPSDFSGNRALDAAASTNDLEAVQVLLAYLPTDQLSLETALLKAVQVQAKDVIQHFLGMGHHYFSPSTYENAIYQAIFLHIDFNLWKILNVDYNGNPPIQFDELFQFAVLHNPNLIPIIVECNWGPPVAGGLALEADVAPEHRIVMDL